MRKTFLPFCLLFAILAACQKNETIPPAGSASVQFPVTEQEKQAVALHKEVGDILLEVYQDEAAWREVNTTIFTGYYQDERVLLQDLLFPEESALFASTAFKKSGMASGLFKDRFLQVLNKGSFPVMRQQLTDYKAAKHPSSNFSGKSHPPSPGQFNNISIYFPYAASFQETSTSRFFPGRFPITIVAADREADVAPGYQLYPCGLQSCSRIVLVNDDYCDSIPTHIITEGAEQPAAQSDSAPQPVQLVFLGSVLCREQYDRLISFTGNGGGSELRFIRGDGFLKQDGDGQINSPENTISVNISRSEIRKKRWVTINSIWDANWETDNKEQVFGIYEEDTEGSKTFAGSIQTKLKNFTFDLIDYSFTVKTKDDIIRQLNWNRESFFLYNQGNLNNGCGNRNGWTVYDCHTPVAYTLPLQPAMQ